MNANFQQTYSNKFSSVKLFHGSLCVSFQLINVIIGFGDVLPNNRQQGIRDNQYNDAFSYIDGHIYLAQG